MNTVDLKEIQAFTKDSSHWWDENGPFKPLHRLNPVRLSYIKERICGRFGRNEKSLKPFKGLSLLDIGCGGGLVCEPMARLGADVTGVDADANAIAVAKKHAAQAGLDISYKATSSEELIKNKQRFDVVLSLEIIEHVANVDMFVEHCVGLCKPGGLVVFSTLNRTPKSYLLGKLAAEYILKWVPAGTHDWHKFLKPSELSRAVRQTGAEVINIEGMAFDPLTRDFQRAKQDLSVNYFLSACCD